MTRKKSDVGHAIAQLVPALEMLNAAITHPEQIATVARVATGQETYKDLEDRMGTLVADSIVMSMAYACTIVLALGQIQKTGGVMFTESEPK